MNKMKYLIVSSIILLFACDEENPKIALSEDEFIEEITFIWNTNNAYIDSIKVNKDTIRYSFYTCCAQNPFKNVPDKKIINKSVTYSNTSIDFSEYYDSQIINEFFEYDSIIFINPIAFETPESRLLKIKTNLKESLVDFRIIHDPEKENSSPSDFKALYKTLGIYGIIYNENREKMIEEEFRE
jgi:hypothetical protein